ncbi:MAG: tail fiber domain-containing protein [Ginsengibacter sp.]
MPFNFIISINQPGKAASIIICLAFITQMLMAQNAIGIGTLTPNASAILDVTATNKGILVPRLSNTQMSSITSPAAGLLIYNTDSAAFAYRTSTGWVFMKGNATASNDWSTKGNAGTDTAKNFIGTTDNKDLIFKQNNIRAGMLSSTNTSWGSESLLLNSSGLLNTAVGSSALRSNTSGNANTAIGLNALYTNISGNSNVAAGNAALYSNTSGIGNTAIGLGALGTNSTGNNNTALGRLSLNLNETGYSNVALGAHALLNNINTSNLVAVGDSALLNNNGGQSNTAVGSKALFSNTLGNVNTANGYNALYSNSGGGFNVATGGNALFSNSLGSGNTATGMDVLRNNNEGSNNTASGFSSLFNNVSGFSNVAVGTEALFSTQTASNLVAVGDSALYNNTDGNQNTAVGSKALFTNTTGTLNTANGYQALYANNTGIGNTAIGASALKNNNSGGNTGIGADALSANTDGYSNTGIGSASLTGNNSGFENVAIGGIALANNINGSANTAVGYGSGNQNTDGSSNVFIGYQAGYNETGSNKLFIANNGANADEALIYGEFDNKILRLNGKVGIGASVPESLLHLNTANTNSNTSQLIIEGNSNYGAPTYAAIEFRNNENSFASGPAGRIKVSPSPLYTGTAMTFQTVAGGPSFVDVMTLTDSKVGIGTTAPASKLTLDGGVGDAFTIINGGDTRIWNDVANGNVSFYASSGAGDNGAVFVIKSDGKTFSFNGTGGSVSSDERLKQDIVPLQGSLQKIMQLNGYSYRFKSKSNNPQREIGVLAQEVKKVLPEAVYTNDDGTYSVSYNSLLPLLINAVKEQQTEIDAFKQKLDRTIVLQKENEVLKLQQQDLAKQMEELKLIVMKQQNSETVSTGK